jgi:outer membrane receptor protein involved in Fe transport
MIKARNILTALIFIPLSLPFYSAFSAEVTLEEIIVTATKRGDAGLQSVSASIFAVGGDDLAVKGQFDFEQFAGSVPGLQFQDLGPGDKEYIIRGINGNGPAVVGSYFGEYVITATDAQDGGGKNAPIKLIDLERIEVLNGPQGTLYGANSMAGTIRFIPRAASTTEFDAFIDADYSDTNEGDDNYTLSGAVNIPVIEDVLGVRLTGWTADNSGWIDQPRRQTSPGEATCCGLGGTLVGTYDGNDKDINDEETTGGRVSVHWNINDNISLDLMYLTQDMEVGGSSRYTQKGGTSWSDLPQDIIDLGAGGFVPLPGLPSLSPSEEFVNTDITISTRDDDVDLFGMTLQWEFDAGNLTASYSNYEHDIFYTNDSTPILLFNGVDAPGFTAMPQSVEIDMLELRFASTFDGPVNFLAGYYQQEEDSQFDVHVTTTDGMGGPVPWDELNANDFFAGGTAFFGRFREDEIDQWAVFGEVYIDIADQWELLIGWRYFDSEIESIQATTHAFVGQLQLLDPDQVDIIGFTANGNEIGKIGLEEDKDTYKISLSYNQTDDVMWYATYSQGFRVGGVNNGNQPFAQGIPLTYGSDELENIEFGIKSRYLEGRMQLNAALFLIDWDDIQVEPRDPAGNIPFTTNGGAAEVNGMEWALSFLLTDNLKWDFNGTYLFDYELTEDQPLLPGASPAIITGLEGDKMPNIPEWQLYTSLEYSIEAGGRPLTFIGDVTYRDDTNTEFRTDSPFNIAIDSYALVNFYANYEITDHITIGLYVKNATDEEAIVDGIGTFQDPGAVVSARPRTIGASFGWKL